MFFQHYQKVHMYTTSAFSRAFSKIIFLREREIVLENKKSLDFLSREHFDKLGSIFNVIINVIINVIVNGFC